ncbi:response regulator [Simplicispira psychrophila]|uniref:response regulator n=1 Tax=Simplicispira psychrophila TaxID=80882 RepID=UPI00048551E0|nr:response regulator transcription factor [Simplicispira psychrophila]
MINLLIVDDHTIFRAGIARLVADEADLHVAAEAADGTEAIALARQQAFDLVLLDINMGARNGFDTLTALRAECPRLPVIMLSMYAESQYARLALRSGANAYLSKDVDTEELLRAIRRVATGHVYMPMGVSLEPTTEIAASHESLSPREMQVMLMITRGISLTEIGEQLCLSVKTIGSHRTRILGKLGLQSNAEMVQYAMRHGFVD